MSNWNGLDFFVFLIFFINTMLGMARGATKEIISLMCLSAGLIFMIKFSVPLATFFNSSSTIQDVLTASWVQNFMNAIGAGPLTADMVAQVCYCVAILICFVGSFSVGEATLKFTGFAEVFSFSFATMNRKIGGALGFSRGYVLSLILILIVQHIFAGNPLQGSFFLNLFGNSAKRMDALIIGQNPEYFRQIYKDQNLYKEQDLLKTVS